MFTKRVICQLLAMSLVLIFCHCALAQEPNEPEVVPALVAYYQMENNYQCSVDPNNDAWTDDPNDPNVNPDFVMGVIGEAAASFDGVQERLWIPPVIKDDWTIGMWFRTDDPFADSEPDGKPGVHPEFWSGYGLLCADVGGSNDDWGTSFEVGAIKFGVGGVGQSNKTLVVEDAIVDTDWHHIAFTRDANNGEIAIYIDGMIGTIEMEDPNDSNSVITVPARMIANSGTKEVRGVIEIGCIKSNSQRYLNGEIDDLRLYNYILDDGAIADLSMQPGELVHQWKLDEVDTGAGAVIADSVGGLDGVVDGDGVASVTGVVGNALSFDGASYVGISDVNTADLKFISVALWINPDPDTLATGGYKRVFSGGDNFEFILQPDTGQVGNNFYRSGGDYPLSEPLIEGEWTHVAATSSLTSAGGSGLMTVYLNGSLNYTNPKAAVAKNDWNGGEMRIAHRPPNNGSHYQGKLDDVRIYKGIITDAQLQAAISGE